MELAKVGKVPERHKAGSIPAIDCKVRFLAESVSSNERLASAVPRERRFNLSADSRGIGSKRLLAKILASFFLNDVLAAIKIADKILAQSSLW